MSFKIQIVEDDKVIATFLAKKLTAVGFDVNTAYDGASGFEQIVEFKPDLVLLDFFLPAGDGLSVLTKLRQSADQNKVPVIVISSGLDETQKSRVMEQGISSYWEKPFNIDVLIAEIEKGRRNISN